MHEDKNNQFSVRIYLLHLINKIFTFNIFNKYIKNRLTKIRTETETHKIPIKNEIKRSRVISCLEFAFNFLSRLIIYFDNLRYHIFNIASDIFQTSITRKKYYLKNIYGQSNNGQSNNGQSNNGQSNSGQSKATMDKATIKVQNLILF